MIVTIETLKQYPLIYLASPYSKYPQSIELAFRDIAKIAAKCMQIGLRVYSPIAHTHPLAIYGGVDPLDHTIWLPFDQAIMDKSDALLIAMMESWEISYGIKEEIKIFSAAGKPIYYLDPHSFTVERQPEESGGL